MPPQGAQQSARLPPAGRLIRQFDVSAAAVSGLAAGAAFMAVLEVNLRLTGRNVDDLMIRGGPFVAYPTKAPMVGAIHVINSLGLAGLYVKLECPIPGSGWLKDLVSANVENVVLYPVTWVEDLYPATRTGLAVSTWFVELWGYVVFVFGPPVPRAQAALSTRGDPMARFPSVASIAIRAARC